MEHRTVPAEAENAMRLLVSRFGSDLKALYLHGSAVAGGLRPRSDVDLLAVVGTPLEEPVARSLVADLLKISGHYPFDAEGRRPIELMVFLIDDLAEFVHPVRCQLVYGEWLRSGFEAGDIPAPATNPDFTLVLAQVRTTGLALAGPPPDELLPAISEASLRAASAESIPDLLDSLVGDERNVLLTLARAWFTATTGDFASKDKAAHWAMERLPAEIADTLAYARSGYLGDEKDDWTLRQAEAGVAARFLAHEALSSLK